MFPTASGAERALLNQGSIPSGEVSEKDDLLLHPSQASDRTCSPSFIRRLLGSAIWISIACVVATIILTSLVISVIAIVQIKKFNPWYQDHAQLHYQQKDESLSGNAPSYSASSLGPPSSGPLSCGSTPTEASANGCTFDIMAFQYVPATCYEERIMVTSLSSESHLVPAETGEFPWYRWSNFTEPVPQTAVDLSRYTDIWTTNDWHLAHCLYMWKLLSHAVGRAVSGEEGVYVLADATEPEHLAHCNALLADSSELEGKPLRVFRVVGECLRLD